MLVQMAERGEIDPWNIDIVEVTDRFLAELERRKELDLRVSGRTLLYAACLLRMKSEHLEEFSAWEGGDEEEDAEFLGDDGELFDDDVPGVERAFGPIERLEREIRRRLERKHLRKRPITLYELINELKNAEKEERRRQRFSIPSTDRFITPEDVVGIAHDEGYMKAAEEVLGAFRECGGVVTLSELAAILGWKVPEVYIPLLFLMAEGRLSFWQEEFFGEVLVAGSEDEIDCGSEAG
ncbi:MAG: segregation/condensation protein A [Methanoregulaceae archaeon]|nr:segregation/condensation protein A [Methanoregulaceae archaeon]